VSVPSCCPACCGPLRLWRIVPGSEPELAARRWPLWRCERCGTARTGGAAPVDPHDSGAYSPGAPRLHELARPALELFDRQRLRLLARHLPPPARILDAGAGRGRWVLAARRAGYHASGIEPSHRGVASAAALEVPVTQSSIAQADLPQASFDGVSLWHVLEHLEDPAADLRRLRRSLRGGGVLLCGVPNLASLQARLGGERWYHLDVPRHRTHFTPQGVRLLLERTGFSVLCVHHLLVEQNPYGMWQSLVSRATRHPAYLYNLLKRNAPLSPRDLFVTLLALPFISVAALLELAADLSRRGGTIAIVATAGGADEEVRIPGTGEG
jgi:SAM-dependent methyltransferase